MLLDIKLNKSVCDCEYMAIYVKVFRELAELSLALSDQQYLVIIHLVCQCHSLFNSSNSGHDPHFMFG